MMTNALKYALPWVLFAGAYSSMRYFPNYEFNSVNIEGLYLAERHLFGLGGVTLCEWWATHSSPLLDVMAGAFYLCWVPVPLLFGVWLLFRRQSALYQQFSWCFLFVNVLGFIGYYLHPAAPPWYALQYGYDFVAETSGNVAALGRFDALTGLPVFHTLYGQNSNVFAAVPSLHAAYMVVTLYYAIKAQSPVLLRMLFAVIMLGIWWAAVYSSHHYLIDVLLGILCAIAGILLFRLLAVIVGQNTTFAKR